MGATLLLAGIVAAIITAPLFDRVFTHHLAISCKVLVPIVGAMWLSLIWVGESPPSTLYLELLLTFKQLGRETQALSSVS